MKFFTKPHEVQAQQFNDYKRPELITLVKLERVPGCRNIYQFTDDTGEPRCVLPHDWIVKWEDETVDVFSELDFSYRFSRRDTLKDALNILHANKKLKKISCLSKLIDEYMSRQE